MGNVKIENKSESIRDSLIEFLVLLAIAVMFFLFLIPAIFNFQSATIAGKVFMVIGSVLYLVGHVLFIVYIEKSYKKVKKGRSIINARIIYIAILVCYIYLLLRYISESIWGTFKIVFVIMALISLFCGCFNIIREFKYLFNSERIPMLIAAFALFLCWLGWMFSESNYALSDVFFKIAVGMLYLIFMSAFLNITVFNLNIKQDKKYQFLKILICISIPLGVLITLPFYVQWCGLTGKNFDTFVTVYSAICGGGLTLIGVAWTIRHQEKIRRDDEKKKHRPIILVSNSYNTTYKAIRLTKFSEKIISYEKTAALPYETYINPFIIRNTEFSPFYIYGLLIDDVSVLTENKIYIDRNDVFVISCEQQLLYTKNEIHSVSLLTQDLLENFYKIPLKTERINSNKIGQPCFKIGTIVFLDRAVSQIVCKDEMVAIELKGFSLKEE